MLRLILSFQATTLIKPKETGELFTVIYALESSGSKIAARGAGPTHGCLTGRTAQL